ncbi:MutS domain III [Pedobacter steynii]|uniref:MutS domain III n=1 Tax=Pedobacter steynii TaxID=430522 RepID=A0A1G9PD68_9SPHI|nr:DNA mismatch repair protein [Pedobacter steynii]NQX39032.1 DNA mismatch repair protein [Pedobacter steynii]SDL96167.1 MutS domain III [Pedobacter steynii]
MSFITDKQTLEDMNLTGKYKPGSIFSFFNKVKTAGGERLLEQLFNNPLTDATEINNRSSIFEYFEHKALTFPFGREQFELMENYLSSNAERNLLFAGIGNFKKQVLGSIVRDDQYETLQKGIGATITILKTASRFFKGLEDQSGIDHPYHQQIQIVKGVFNNKQLEWLSKENGTQAIPFFKLTKYDHLLRHTLQRVLAELIGMIYSLDVYIAVANLAHANGFTYASALPRESNFVNAEGLAHPSLSNAVGNNISFRQESNVVFLTGANMAGKSTLMKTFGISLYLAHMGFPIAAKSMTFSVRGGIYSSINVPDNLNMGLSHFYAEVLRVKKVAGEVSTGKDLVVIFDELFKGTNVKDAYDATLAVTAAFSEYTNCCFVISTHIIEVGEALKENEQIQFLYLPTIMEGNKPRYTYSLEKGITTDRQGMIIIENEGILDLL